MEGWIKLYRSTLENPIVCKDSDHLAIWSYLLMKATHKRYDVVFGGKRVTLQPGQLITGRREISRTLSLNESKVQRVLTRFKNEHQIEQQTTSQNRLVTITNWGKYQQSEQQSEQRVNNDRTTSEQRVNTNKNDKNDKKGEGEASSHRSLEDRKADFKQEIWDAGKDKYPKAMLKAFYDYWTEAGKGAKKMRFEKEKAFEIPKRLATWAKRDKEFGRANSSPDEPETKTGDIRGEVM